MQIVHKKNYMPIDLVIRGRIVLESHTMDEGNNRSTVKRHLMSPKAVAKKRIDFGASNMNKLGLHELLNELDEEDSCCKDTKHTLGCPNASVKTVAETSCTSGASCSSNSSFNSSTNIRGNEQCTFTSTDTGETQQTGTSPPIQFKHSILLSPEELFLYCCLRTEFPENPFITCHEEKYHNVADAMKAVYGYQFSSHSIKNYLERASRNLVKNLGKQN